MVGFGLQIYEDERIIKNSNSYYVGVVGRDGFAFFLGRADFQDGSNDKEVGGENYGRGVDYIKVSKSKYENFFYVRV